MAKVGLDLGHGRNTYPPSKGVPSMAEFSFNQGVGKVAKRLLEESGVEVVLGQPFDSNDVPLGTRTDKYNAEDVDIVMSVHADFNGNDEATGFWGFYWYTSSGGRRLAQIWSKHLEAESDMRDRGIQQSKRGSWTNFHMVRETKAPAVLMEHGFMSNKNDLAKLKSTKYRTEAGIALAKAACEYLGIPFKGKVTATASASTNSSSISTNEWFDRKGKDVKELQDLLLAAGEKLPKFGADAHFGKETLLAVQSFQRKHDISTPKGDFYGVPGPRTMEKLSEVTESKVIAKAPEEVKKEEAKDPHRLHTGTFPTAEALANGIKRLEKEFSWIFYERAESTKFNAGYRIFTGVYPTKEAAERAAERIRELTGWLVYVIEA
ncbi:N-acetylmuramoyl-L-alanine amidase [Sinobaca qinghaiensis]|uniref:N-acetylmuramoyl-L-alanine amidase n=1 Tax=Sinobaca qinghaiensis TaxID=342944 RepID=A0A419V5V0_9BACL|nr:N-acetylmuramoyl-L-alanine amidase [Sinobaca qinghaiensis]RKD75211.1 N-acetylmuramoyl-L-alanine amidase [Sinobaca qinghaiensis]